MIISDKQIMQLINLARAYSESMRGDSDWRNTLAYDVDMLLLDIQNQQSEELHTTKEEK